MKTTVLLSALIFGFIIPTYSQLNHHRKMEPTRERLQHKKNDDFGIYRFDDKFSGPLMNETPKSFNLSPIKPAHRRSMVEIYSGDDMPRFNPTGKFSMPCYKPAGEFPMRVYKPDSIVREIAW
jgi:hypothetical protein